MLERVKAKKAGWDGVAAAPYSACNRAAERAERATARRQADAQTIGVKLPGVQGGQQRLGVQMRPGGVQGLC